MSSNQYPKKYGPTFWIFMFGFVVFCLYMLKGHFLPDHVAHRKFINTVLLLLSTISLSGCAFFSLREFFCDPAAQSQKLSQAFGAALIVGMLFLTDYLEYSFINKQLIKFESPQIHLSDFVEAAHISDNPKSRAAAAEAAYLGYGVRLTYRDENNNWIYYAPSAEDVKARASATGLDASVKNLRVVSLGLLAGTADVVLAALLTFFTCLIWAAFKDTPRHAPQITPD